MLFLKVHANCLLSSIQNCFSQPVDMHRYIQLHVPDPFGTSCGISAHIPATCNDTWNIFTNRTNGRWCLTVNQHLTCSMRGNHTCLKYENFGLFRTVSCSHAIIKESVFRWSTFAPTYDVQNVTNLWTIYRAPVTFIQHEVKQMA